MSTHNFFGKYYFLRGMTLNQECNLLFITDLNNSYYLEKDGGASYQRLLRKYTSAFDPSKVTLFGSSMSGYAALFHSALLNANAIVCNPQISYQVTFDNAWQDLKRTLKKVVNFIDLDVFLDGKRIDSVWHISHGTYPMDVANISKLQNANFLTSRIMYQKMEDEKHGFYLKDPKSVYKLAHVLQILRNIEIKV